MTIIQFAHRNSFWYIHFALFVIPFTLLVGEFGGAAAADEEDEDALMQRALEMSMREMLSVNESSSGGAAGTESKTEEEEVN